MNRGLVLIPVVTLLFTAHAALAQSSPSSDRNLMFTEGSAEVTGKNDSAKMAFAVVTGGRDLQQASAENAGRTRAVLEAVKALDIETLKLETANYRITPQKDYNARPPMIKGYEVYHAVEATLEGFEPERLSGYVSKLVGRALESGANDVQHIQFYIKNKKPLEKEALIQATREAVDRAATLAKAAGVKLKRIASLSTQPVHMPVRAQAFRTAEMGVTSEAMAPPVETGESRIRVHVHVVYEIE